MTLENPTNEIQKQILALVQAVEKLRGPGGCPWDQEQNHQRDSRKRRSRPLFLKRKISKNHTVPCQQGLLIIPQPRPTSGKRHVPYQQHELRVKSSC